MKLQEWIDNKCKELVDSKTFKDASLKSVDKCQISNCMTSQIFDLWKRETIDMNTEVEDVIRRELQGEIDALEVVFNVVKPRCRKPERYVQFIKVV